MQSVFVPGLNHIKGRQCLLAGELCYVPGELELQGYRVPPPLAVPVLVPCHVQLSAVRINEFHSAYTHAPKELLREKANG